MNTPDPRAEARNRASRRLRRMTIGTAALGVASVGLFGATPAFTYHGTQATADAVAFVVTGDTGSTSTTTSSSSTTSTTPTVTSTTGNAHASTGGS